jgi:YidC/Oxa1 family membrane protein insertase
VPAACHLAITTTHVAPRYIPNTSKMYCNLIASNGKMESFGIDLALKPFSHHSSWVAAIPYFALVGLAVVLQYVQMSQMNKRNSAAQTNSQMATLQKFMPIVFAYIYFLIPAAVLIYMIVSTLIRLGTQDVIFRTGMVQAPAGGAAVERARPAIGSKEKGQLAKGDKVKGADVASAEEDGGSASKPQANPGSRSKKKKKRKDR